MSMVREYYRFTNPGPGGFKCPCCGSGHTKPQSRRVVRHHLNEGLLAHHEDLAQREAEEEEEEAYYAEMDWEEDWETAYEASLSEEIAYMYVPLSERLKIS